MSLRQVFTDRGSYVLDAALLNISLLLLIKFTGVDRIKRTLHSGIISMEFPLM